MSRNVLFYYISTSNLFNFFFFFFNDTATTEIYTLSLHDALPIFVASGRGEREIDERAHALGVRERREYALPFLDGDDHVLARDRKSTRLNSSHSQISYAVFCLKKKKQEIAAQL